MDDETSVEQAQCKPARELFRQQMQEACEECVSRGGDPVEEVIKPLFRMLRSTLKSYPDLLWIMEERLARDPFIGETYQSVISGEETCVM